MKKIIILVSLIFLFACGQESAVEVEINQNTITQKGIVQTGAMTTETFDLGEIKTATGIISETGSELQEKVDINTGAILNDDESITKYINDKIHYTKINYVPKNLVAIKSDFVSDTKGNQLLRDEANQALQMLAKDFYQEFQVKLKVVSAYRSYNYQVWIKKGGCSDLFCAKAGYSEHQSGLAFDMFETTSNDEFLSKPNLKKYFRWMIQNAHKYGFHNSYQKGKQIDGYAIEPWHWRYLGIDFAKELQEKNMTYAEYYQLYGQK